MSKIILLTLVLTLTNVANSNQLIEDVFVALNEVLNYIFDHHESINVDGLFGVVFGKVHIGFLYHQLFENTDYIFKIACLKRKIDQIYQLIQPKLPRDNKKIKLFIDNILIPNHWTREIDFKPNQLNLNYNVQLDNYDLSKSDDFFAYLQSSNISASISDDCLIELISSGSYHNYHNCTVSKYCQDYMINNEYIDPTYGITHRLLYLQIAKSLKCTIDKQWYRNKVTAYCTYIFWELKKNAQFGYKPQLDDLFLEQITLCGFEGFDEFFYIDFIQHILDIQTEFGCFKIGNEKYLEKRSLNLIKFGCYDHTTGLGVSSLSLILRYLLNNSY